MLDPNPDDLRESVALYRDVDTSAHEREQILQWWSAYEIPNPFAAMLRAAEIEKGAQSND